MKQRLQLKLLNITITIVSIVLDSELLIPGYSILRLDRNRHGGGILLMVKDSLSFTCILSGPHNMELVFLSISLPSSKKLCLGVFYRPPSSTSALIDLLTDTVALVNPAGYSRFLLLGDFNINMLKSSSNSTRLTNLMSGFNLALAVSEPTHVSPDGSTSLIDLVLTSDQELTKCVVIPPLENSDCLLNV